jgi:hypothetical protein
MGNASTSSAAKALSLESRCRMCITLDKDVEEDVREAERVLKEVWDRASETDPLHFARSAPWDALREATPEDFAAGSEAAMLKRLLSLPIEADSLDGTIVTGDPESTQFIYRYFPGVVKPDRDDGTPAAARHWRTTFSEFEGDTVPFVELQRAHPGDREADNCMDGVEASQQSGFDPRKMSPLTTKAGSRLWGISFASPLPLATAEDSEEEEAPAPEVSTLRACYPMQLLVRFDAGRQMLCYDAFEFEPTLPSVSKAAFAAPSLASGGGGSSGGGGGRGGGPESLVTRTELRRVESLIKRTKKQMTAVYGAFSNFLVDGGGGALVGTDAELAVPPRDLPFSERLRLHGETAVRILGDWVKFRHSLVRRVRFPVSAVIGARLVIFERGASTSGGGAAAADGADVDGLEVVDLRQRPNGHLPAASDAHGKLSDLGKPAEDQGYGEGERVAQGVAELAGSPELEPLALLVLELELGAPSSTAASVLDFAAAKLWPTNRTERIRAKIPDWTPGGIASRARRHYLLGDKEEMLELCNYLAQQSPHLGTLLRPRTAADDMEEEEEAGEAAQTDRSCDGSPPQKKAARWTEEPKEQLPAHVAKVVSLMRNSLAGTVQVLDPWNAQSVSSLAHRAALALARTAESEGGISSSGGGGGGGGGGSGDGRGGGVCRPCTSSPFADCAAVEAFLERCGAGRVSNACLKASSPSDKARKHLVYHR